MTHSHNQLLLQTWSVLTEINFQKIQTKKKKKGKKRSQN